MNKRHIPILLLTLFAGSAFAAPPATATQDPQADLNRKMQQLQQQMSDLSQRMGQLAAQMGDNARATVFDYIADPGRGTIGLAMRPASDGEEIVALSPGAPAERAGLKVGDVVTAVDGHHARDNHDEVEALLARSEVGKPVKIELLRDGKTRTFTLVPERRQPGDWQRIINAVRLDAANGKVVQREITHVSPGANKMLVFAPGHGDAAFPAHRNSISWLSAPWWGLNLASLNPDLGGYFGVERGALVLSTDSDNYPGLKAGDVITGIDGKVVEQPEDVMRALRGRHDDKPVHLALRRHGKNVGVDLKAPQLSALFPPAPPLPPAPPVPATPAAPPAPPAPPAPAGI